MISSPNSNNAISQVPGFPLEVLPPVLQSFIRKSNEADGMSIDHLAAAILGTASIAIGRTHKLQLHAGMQHSGQLFLALVGKPDVGKSRSLERALAPVCDYNARQYEEFKQEQAAYAVKQGRGRRKGPRPSWKGILVEDTKPKILSRLNDENPRGIAICPYNLVNWLSGFRKERTRRFWRYVWSDDAIEIGLGTREAIELRFPYIPVLGDMQPDDIVHFGKGAHFAPTLRHRLLFAWPEIREKPLWSSKVVPEELKAQYESSIQRLLELTLDEGSEPHLIICNKECRKLIMHYILQERSATDEENEEWAQSDVKTMWQTHVVRFCLLLQLIWWAFEDIEKDHLDREMTARAIRLADYFWVHSGRVFAYAGKHVSGLML